MKNSAWYRKLWRKKLEELPYCSDPDKAWLNMSKILDEQLPVSNTISGDHKIVRPFAAKVISLLGFVLPAAAMVFTTSYFLIKHHSETVNKTHPATHTKKLTGTTHAKYIMPDSNPGLNIAAHHDSFNYAKQVNYTPLTDSLPNTGKSSRQNANTHLLTVPSLATNGLNSNNLINPTKISKHKIAKQRLMAQSHLKTIGHTGAYHNIVNLNKSPQLTGATNPDTKFNMANSLTNKPNLNNLTTHDIVNGGLENNSPQSGSTLINQSGNAQAGNKISEREKLKDAKSKSDNRNKPAKTKKSTIFNSIFGNRHIKGSELIYGTGFNYGIKAGYAANNITGNLYLGTYASLPIRQHWVFTSELLLHTAKTISGSYLHNSYFRPDSIAPFTISNSRKVYLLDIPLNLGYKVSKTVSLKAGPTFSIAVKQTGVISKLSNVPDLRDTIMHTQDINTALNKTVLTPKFNVGASAGIGIQVKRFYIEAKYQQSFVPYKGSSDLGDYKFTSRSLMFGIGFQLNKGR